METLSRTEPMPGGTRLRLKRPRLYVEAGPDAGRHLDLDTREVVVGRSAEADWTLEDPAVSRRHLRVHPERDGFRVEDLGSRTGTRIDGVRVESAHLGVGQALSLGDTVVRVTLAETELHAFRTEETELDGLLGASAAMRDLFAMVTRVALLELPVWIHGETGTGKEGLAEALHRRSGRAAGPFVIVDGTMLTDPSLARSELFGHRKGAFTGATEDREGAFVKADGGTLFLDEVGELPAEVQAQLLRVLQSGEVRPVGADEPRAVSVRVVCATHQDLAARTREGSFREDLFYRLASLSLEVPPLRDRGEDVLLLARAFLPDSLALAPEARDALLAHPWPGNVRELQTVMARAAALAGGGAVGARDLGLAGGRSIEAPSPPAPAEAEELLAARSSDPVDDAAILAALKRTGGNRERAAALLGIGRSTLFRRLKKMRERDEG